MIVPNWPQLKTPITVNPNLAEKVTDSNLSEQDVVDLSKELLKVDRWAKSDFRMSKYVF